MRWQKSESVNLKTGQQKLPNLNKISRAEYGAKQIFGEVTAEDFLNMAEDVNIMIQKAQ